ncbi:hypothetical protein BPIT_27020 [Candidatus Brocadia pituitae]|nr:hypothetical protein BPIT_27020 [Candidatus Brocadia pituitae]
MKYKGRERTNTTMETSRVVILISSPLLESILRIKNTPMTGRKVISESIGIEISVFLNEARF